MATLPTGITQAQVERLAQLSLHLDALNAEKELLVKDFKDALAADGVLPKKTLIYPSTQFGNIIVDFGEQRRITKESLAELSETYPSDTYPAYWVTELDPNKLPKIISDAFRTSTPTLKVTVESMGITGK